MNVSSMYLEICTGTPDAQTEKYFAPVNGRTCNYVVSPNVEGTLVGVWHNIHSDMGNLGAFSLIDVLPYQQAKENGVFESADAEAVYPDRIPSLFILRLAGVPGQEAGVGMTLKVNVLYE